MFILIILSGCSLSSSTSSTAILLFEISRNQDVYALRVLFSTLTRSSSCFNICIQNVNDVFLRRISAFMANHHFFADFILAISFDPPLLSLFLCSASKVKRKRQQPHHWLFPLFIEIWQHKATTLVWGGSSFWRNM